MATNFILQADSITIRPTRIPFATPVKVSFLLPHARTCAAVFCSDQSATNISVQSPRLSRAWKPLSRGERTRRNTQTKRRKAKKIRSSSTCRMTGYSMTTIRILKIRANLKISPRRCLGGFFACSDHLCLLTSNPLSASLCVHSIHNIRFFICPTPKLPIFLLTSPLSMGLGRWSRPTSATSNSRPNSTASYSRPSSAPRGWNSPSLSASSRSVCLGSFLWSS
jgi:hypothetical protein